MQLIVEYIKENKKTLLIILVLFVLLSFVSLYINGLEKKKVYLSESFVYTKESYNHDEYLTSELPYINVKGEEISEINEGLIKKYYEIVTVDQQIMKYNSYVSDNILSLIVKIYYKESPDSYPAEVLIYNVDIDSGVVYDDKQLLNIFNISSNDVSEIIRDELKDYYDYEIKSNYIDKGCDFECYLSSTDSLPILENCNYYVRDNTLFIYKSIIVDIQFFYDADSGFYLFNFEIKDKM